MVAIDLGTKHLIMIGPALRVVCHFGDFAKYISTDFRSARCLLRLSHNRNLRLHSTSAFIAHQFLPSLLSQHLVQPEGHSLLTFSIRSSTFNSHLLWHPPLPPTCLMVLLLFTNLDTSAANTCTSTSHASSQNSPSPRLYACNWNWCRNCYTSRTERNDHVIQYHVRQAIPVFRRDLPILRKAQEGIGESLSLSGLMGTQSQACQYNGRDEILTQGELNSRDAGLPSSVCLSSCLPC